MISPRTHNPLVAFGLILFLSWAGPTDSTAANASIRNIPPTPHFAPAGTPMEDLALAIKMAAAAENWDVLSETTGNISLQLEIRNHRANVIVGYDESRYWIDYSDSFNLDYSPNDWRRAGKNSRTVKGPRIHHNYNIWVKQLSSAIAAHAKAPPKAVAADPVSSGELLLIADEIEKLNALRERGVLTQQEFDQQKAKLLSR